jgi:hypothetical protein
MALCSVVESNDDMVLCSVVQSNEDMALCSVVDSNGDMALFSVVESNEDMALRSLIESNEDFEEANCFHPKVRIMSVQQNFEPTALGWLKVCCHAEVPEQDEQIFLLSIDGYRLAIDYFGVVKGGAISSPRFVGGF